MKVLFSRFVVEYKDRRYTVEFSVQEERVSVWEAAANVRLMMRPNTADQKDRYKPCQSHAFRLVKEALRKGGESHGAVPEVRS